MTTFDVRDGAHLEELDDELLVLAPGTADVYRLVGDAAEAMRLARARTTAADLPRRLEGPMAELVDAGLVTAEGWDRRRVLMAGAAGAAGLFLLALPTPAMAQSIGGSGGSDPFDEGSGGVAPPAARSAYPTTPGVVLVGLASVGSTVQDPGSLPPNVSLLVDAIFSDGSRWDVSGDATWSISGAGTNTVDPTGLVTYGTGHNIVKVSYGGFNRFVQVWGADAPGTGTLQRIEVSPNAVTGGNQSPFSFVAFAYTDSPSFGSGPQDITTDPGTTWSTSTPALVSVDAAGVATALAPGVAKITATYGGKRSTATWVISSGLTIRIAANYGFSMQLIAESSNGSTATDVTADPGTTWTSDNPATADVDATGGVSVGVSGVANITATFGPDTSNTIQITV